ncbi:amidase [Paractinoplanes lichenicola]|uniref:Amidase n=1 Tax=Paractinoplanes lichenicola TaxID=2802976 RepID=A0ABS1VL67_9ACTN|nr:amidase [Actinoplanes lichenicola]MBL7255380.1 amidase [Actinoplanes lichenicola]
MTVPKPTTADISALAQELGYPAVAEAAKEYTAMITGMLGIYDAVEAVPEPAVLPGRGAVAYRVPSAEEDPHHAWEVRASIPGAAAGPLAGVRLGVKDSIMVSGLPMANGSDVLAGFVPAGDATVVTRALEAGAEIVGKTTNEYFCMSGGSHTAYSGPVHNPHRIGTSSGGSSSGSAVALVTGQADMTLGADQAGSIRMPASWSGVVGLKPTYGLVPYTGIAPLDGFFDHVGPMTRTVADNARFLTVLAGPDGIDPRQSGVRAGDYLGALDHGVRGLRVGILREGFGGPDAEAAVDHTVRAAAESLRDLGAVVEDVSVPLHALGPALWTAIAIEGMAETVLRNQGFAFGRADHYPVDMMRHLFDRRDTVAGRPANVMLFTLVGRYVDAHQGRLNYAKAINRTRTLRAAYDEALQRYDVLVTPTTPQTARPLPDPAAGPGASVQAAIEMSANTTPFNITHHPALSVPCGTAEGLPVGLQLVGRHFDEATLYRVGRALEQA